MTERTPSTVIHRRQPGLPVFTIPKCLCGSIWPCPWAPKEEAVAPTPPTQTAAVAKKRGFEVTIEGLPPIIFLGWRSTHGAVRVAALPKPVNRALIEARATIDGSLRSAAAILRPGDKFDRETGKRIALARLVAALIPASPTPELKAAADKKALAKECQKRRGQRSKLFREIWKRTHKGKLPAKPRTTFDLTAALNSLAPPTKTWNWFYSRYPEPAPIGKVISVDEESGELLTTRVGLTPPGAAPITPSEKG